MRKLAVSTIGIFLALLAAACSSSSDGGAVVTPPGVGQIVPPNSCQVGQVDAPGYGCLDRHTCDYGYGWVPHEYRCVPGTPVTGYDGFDPGYSGRYYGKLTITNRSAFADMLRYAGLCDPYTYNWGTWSCDYWAKQGGFIDLAAYGGAAGAPVQLYVGAGNSFYPGYSIGFPQSAMIVDYNEFQGMQIVGVTSGGQDVGLRIIVESGRIGDSSFKATVRFGHTTFATTVFVRY